MYMSPTSSKALREERVILEGVNRDLCGFCWGGFNCCANRPVDRRAEELYERKPNLDIRAAGDSILMLANVDQGRNLIAFNERMK